MNILTVRICILALLISGAQARANTDQYVALLYTELLGRLPDPVGFKSHSDYVRNGSTSRLKDVVTWMITSSEFQSKALDSSAIVFVIYRSVLLREPDLSGLSYYRSQLDSGAISPTQLVSILFASTEFQNDARPKIVQSTPAGFRPGNYCNMGVIGGGQADFTGGTSAQLSALLATKSAGDTVTISKRAVIAMSSQVNVPQGVTIKTLGFQSGEHYTSMARFIAVPGFSGPAVLWLNPGSKLEYVWVDGNKRNLGRTVTNNLTVLGGYPSGAVTTVSRCKIADTCGFTNMHVLNEVGQSPMGTRAYVGDNIITCYNNFDKRVAGQQWCDGISVDSSEATVEWNAIVDASDVGIVFFRNVNGDGEPHQESKAYNNWIVNAGNNAFAAFNAYTGAQLIDGKGTIGNPIEFGGSEFAYNKMWTSVSAHQQFGIALGSRMWSGGTDEKYAWGGAVFNNKIGASGSFKGNYGVAIAISGMLGATVANNTLNVTIHQAYTNCYAWDVVIGTEELNSVTYINQAAHVYNLVNCLK
jgi:hypothetical protein